MKKIIFGTLLLVWPAWSAQALDVAAIESYLDQGHYEKVGALVADAAAQKNPDHRALFYRARALLFSKQLEEAQKLAEKAVKAAPDSAAYWAQLGAAKAFRIRERPLRGITLARSCKKDFERAVKLDPTHLESLWALVRFHMHAPGLVGGSKDKAWEYAEAILALNPAQGHQARGQLYLQVEEDMEKARRENLAALDADPGNAKLAYEIGLSLLNQGYGEEALYFYRQGSEWDEDQAAGLVRLGGVHLKLGQLAEASSVYRQALAADPDEVGARLGEGEILLAQKQTAEAIALFRELAAAYPEHPPVKYHLAAALIEADQDPVEAEQLLEEYLATNINFFWPSRAQANWQLALAQENLGAYNLAYETITLAQELSWGNDEMENDADRLEFMANE